MRIVLKFGTGILTRESTPEPDPVQLRKLMEAVALLKRAGHSCIVVSSGAVAFGLQPLGYPMRPTEMVTLQACAAIGQSLLIAKFESLLRDHGLHAAQVLVTHDDLVNADRAQRIRSTLNRLLEFPNVVPVINENDCVAIEELRFGDNDRLSASVAVLCAADLLLILTSAPGLLADPAHPEQGPIPRVDDIAAALQFVSQGKTELGSGGMQTKLLAAQSAVEAGIPCIIASGRATEQVPDLVEGDGIGTRFPVSL